MERIFNVTANAARRIETLIAAEGQDGARMRVEVLGGGCSGFQYQFKFDDSTADRPSTFSSEGMVVLDAIVDACSTTSYSRLMMVKAGGSDEIPMIR